MTDTKLLNAKIEESGLKKQYIAVRCGITYQALLNKINNKSDFTAPEIKILRALLNLTAEEVELIFFTIDVE